ncbi:hypothetical protein D3C72_323310 [compost metagenome]
MDERNIRTGRTTDVGTDVDRDVDIRRTMIMGRDLDYTGTPRVLAAAPVNRVLHWGPIFAGLITTLVSSLLLGALALGLGFEREYGVFGGLTGAEVGWGAVVISLLGVFIGAYLTGYVSNLRSKAEGILNGFMVGVMTIFTPILLAIFGASTAAAVAGTNLPDTTNATGAAQGVANNIAAGTSPAVDASVRNAMVLAADNAWTVFLGGLLILGLATLAGYLGAKSREKAIEKMVEHDVKHNVAV